MDRYLERRAGRRGAAGQATWRRRWPAPGCIPVLAVCATDGRGCAELLDLCVRGFPAPSEHPAQEAFTPSGASAGHGDLRPGRDRWSPRWCSTSSDQYVGRVSIVRVFSGTLVPDASVHVSGHFSAFFADDAGHEDHDEDERIGALAHPFGQHQVPAARVVAGDIASIGRLSRAETGDTLSSPDQPRVLKPVDDADRAAAGGHRGAVALRRGQAVHRAGPAAGRGPEPADRAERRDRPGGALGDGRGARRSRRSTGCAALRRRGGAARR